VSIKDIFPLLAGVVAAALIAAPASAGDRDGRWTTQGDQVQWGHSATDGRVTRGNSRGLDRWETRQERKRGSRAERRAERRPDRKAARRAERRAQRSGRSQMRAAPDGGQFGHASQDGALTQTLNQYDLPDYIGGYNQPPRNGGSITQTLEPYNLPDYSGGRNQGQGGQGSITEALSGYDLPDYNPAN